MKHLSTLAMIVILSSAFAQSALAYTCKSKNLTATFSISNDVEYKEGAINECNGGVGDEMRDCQLRTYKYQESTAELTIGSKTTQVDLILRMTKPQNYPFYFGSDEVDFEGIRMQVHIQDNNTNYQIRVIYLSGEGPSAINLGTDLLTCR